VPEAIDFCFTFERKLINHPESVFLTYSKDHPSITETDSPIIHHLRSRGTDLWEGLALVCLIGLSSRVLKMAIKKYLSATRPRVTRIIPKTSKDSSSILKLRAPKYSWKSLRVIALAC
jgi:hypothetical protein